MKKKGFLLAAIGLFLLFLLAGCAPSRTKVEVKPPSQDDNHIKVEQKDIALEVSNQPKNFDKLIQANQEGYHVVGLKVAVVNRSASPLHISPEFVEIETDAGNRYKYNKDDTAISGRSAFRELQLPAKKGNNEPRGGGILLFEIKKNEKIIRVHYNDDSGHSLTVNYDQPAMKI